MKIKKKAGALCLAVSLVCMLPSAAPNVLHAEDFAGNEEYYANLCTQYTEDPAISATCSAYRSYLSSKSSDLRDQVASMNNDIDSIRNNIDAIQTQINAQQKTIDSLNALIEENNAAIAKIQGVIVELQAEIKQTEADIKKRDDQIKDRMRSEQASIGTNVYVEFMMGAKDLVDMVRIADGIERITENDQDEIKALEADKVKLQQQKDEQDRLKADQEKAKKENEENKKAAEEAKKKQQEYLTIYRQQEADLLEKVRAANAAISAISSKIIAVDSVKYQASSGWIRPVANGTISAHTFAYPGGGFHAGEDFAAPVGSSIVAPIGGVIVYANNPVGTYSGYLNNWSGHPSGGGNTIHMVGTVNGTTYGVSFFHLAQENFAAYAGMAVSQGTYIGAVGHSGNSTGPHCHVEVINLGSISTDQAIAQFRSNRADFAWGTGWNTTATSCASKGSAPCRERPENFFGG